jgi:anion-transporting  ArsA/GET3 family ATPase
VVDAGSDWERVRLHVVTGKGGTGKTTVAAALALALATGGRRVLMAEVEGRQGIARAFDVPPLMHDERRVAVAPGGGDVYGLAVDARSAMFEYLDIYYKMGRAARSLDRLGAVDFATTIAPGMRDVLLTGKTYEAARRKERRGVFVYDAVVLDAPPTGRIARFLNVNTEVAGLARVGPIHRQAESIMRLLRSAQTAVHVTTILEDMPVQETVDGVAELRRVHLPVGGIIVNRVRPTILTTRELAAARKGTLDRTAVVGGLTAAGLADDDGTLTEALIFEAAEHAERVLLENRLRRTVAELKRPTYELPRLSRGVDLDSLGVLAESLRQQGAA